MLKRLPELLINGVSLYLIGKELTDNSKNSEQWQAMCMAKEQELLNLKAENKEGREEVRALHLQFLELMGQVREVEAERTEIYRMFLRVVEQVEEMGFLVNEEGYLYEPEEVNAESLQAILEGEDGEED